MAMLKRGRFQAETDERPTWKSASRLKAENKKNINSSKISEEDEEEEEK